jgi:hypothetical protein
MRSRSPLRWRKGRLGLRLEPHGVRVAIDDPQGVRTAVIYGISALLGTNPNTCALLGIWRPRRNNFRAQAVAPENHRVEASGALVPAHTLQRRSWFQRA